jgi:hypothetical protein
MGEIALQHLGRQHVHRKARELLRDRGRARRHAGARRQVAGLMEDPLSFLRFGDQRMAESASPSGKDQSACR